MAKMVPKIYREDRQRFTSTRMSLPLFMLSRNRIRENGMDFARSHFGKAAQHYNKYCQDENRGKMPSAATYAYNRHIAGYDKSKPHAYPEQRPLHFERTLAQANVWQQAPNRYSVPTNPFESRSGGKNANFAKLHTHKSRVPKKLVDTDFYDTKPAIDRLLLNPHKGVFLSNARAKRATLRHMIEDHTSCWRDPDEPGPYENGTDYYTLSRNLKPKLKSKPPNPHLFGRLSCVPVRPNTMVPRNASFEPGPGRYDPRFGNVCPCPSHKRSMPGLTLRLEMQKRMKFRRQPFKRFNRKLYCEPDWRHVKGKGFTYLFQMSHRDQPKPEPKKKKPDSKKNEKHITMFADAKYIQMVLNPKHIPISIREFPVPPYVPTITFNCTGKYAVRKQLRNNKKIAFNSGQERFPGGPRPKPLTQADIAQRKARLPSQLRLVHRPIKIDKTKLKSKLNHVPPHMQLAYAPKLRKRLFKFLPIPPARVLVTDADIKPDLVFDPNQPTGLYRQKIDQTTFYRDGVLAQLERKRLGMDEDESFATDDISAHMSASASKGSRLTHYSRAMRSKTQIIATRKSALGLLGSEQGSARGTLVSSRSVHSARASTARNTPTSIKTTY